MGYSGICLILTEFKNLFKKSLILTNKLSSKVKFLAHSTHWADSKEYTYLYFFSFKISISELSNISVLTTSLYAFIFLNNKLTL